MSVQHPFFQVCALWGLCFSALSSFEFVFQLWNLCLPFYMVSKETPFKCVPSVTSCLLHPLPLVWDLTQICLFVLCFLVLGSRCVPSAGHLALAALRYTGARWPTDVYHQCYTASKQLHMHVHSGSSNKTNPILKISVHLLGMKKKLIVKVSCCCSFLQKNKKTATLTPVKEVWWMFPSASYRWINVWNWLLVK